MGQKVNPHGLRVGVIKDWDSRWYAEADFADNLVEDYNIRKFLKNKLKSSSVSKIEIERASDRVKVIIYTAKPGVVIGKGGAEIEKTKAQVQKLTDKKVFVDIKEVKRPDRDAQLVAENIAQQLENRISFRRAMKSAMGRTMKAGAKSGFGLAFPAGVRSANHPLILPAQTRGSHIRFRAPFWQIQSEDPSSLPLKSALVQFRALQSTHQCGCASYCCGRATGLSRIRTDRHRHLRGSADFPDKTGYRQRCPRFA